MGTELRNQRVATTLLVALLVSCGRADVVNPPDDATGSAYIVDERVFGREDLWTTVWGLTRSPDGLVAHGLENSRGFASLVDNAWETNWSVKPFSVLGATVIEFLSAPTITIAVGYSGDRSISSVALVATYDENGSPVDTLLLANGSPILWLNDVGVRSIGAGSAQMVGVGAVVSGDRTPFLVYFEVLTNGTLVFDKDKVFEELPGASFWEVDITPDQAVYAAGPRRDALDAFVWQITDSLAARPVASLGRYAGVRELVAASEGLFLAGWHDAEDDTLGSNAYVGAFTCDGVVLWERESAFPEGSAGFQSCAIDAGRLYAVGYAGYSYVPATQREYGQGLLTIVDSASGQGIAQATFGNAAVSSGLNGIVVSGNDAYLAGWTNEAINPGGFQGWFVTVDLAAMLQIPEASVMNPVHGGPAARTGRIAYRGVGGIACRQSAEW